MTPKIELMQGDCLELLKQIPAGSVDAVVTDPPYGMGKDFNGNKSDSEQNAMWLLQASFTQIARVLNPAGMVFVCSGTRLIDRTIEFGKSAGLKFERLLWIYKPNDCTFPWRGWLLKSEAIAVFSKGKPAKWARNSYCHDTYVFNHSGGELPSAMHHPCVKPIKIIEDIVTKIPGDTVIDPFMGSGTTGVACVRTGRNFIGMELDEGYFKIAQERIENEIKKRDENLLNYDNECASDDGACAIA